MVQQVHPYQRNINQQVLQRLGGSAPVTINRCAPGSQGSPQGPEDAAGMQGRLVRRSAKVSDFVAQNPLPRLTLPPRLRCRQERGSPPPTTPSHRTGTESGTGGKKRKINKRGREKHSMKNTNILAFLSFAKTRSGE